MQALNYIQSVLNFGFFFCLGLYVYYMAVRMGKKKNVDLQMWIVVCAGLLLSMAGQVIGIVQGNYGWAQIRISMIASGLLLVAAVWIIYRRKLWRKEEIQPDKKNKGGERKQAEGKNKNSAKSNPKPKPNGEQKQKKKPKR